MKTARVVPDRRPTRLEFAVFGSGVASMGLEILAGRMIAPEFGSSIFTWGSIIGVFLAALSYGYLRGGREAERWASEARIARLALATALYIAGVVLVGDLLLRSASSVPLPPRFRSLPAIVLLFGPPTFLLGYISPYVAELSEKEGLGRASGHVYAVGTIGSIVGAFGTTFVLIPVFDVPGIGAVLGGTALAVAVAMVGRDAPWQRHVGVIGVSLVLLVAVGSTWAGVGVEGTTIHKTQTPYQQLEVVDDGDIRTLYLDGDRHSAMDLEDPDRHVFAYTRYFHLPFLFEDDIDRVLFVGGGGFTGPKRFLAEYDVTVDVVELDPGVIDAAKQYFGVAPSPRLRIHQGDAREFLQRTNRTYDLIVLDAFRQDAVPFHLTTLEFVRLTDDRLTDDGVLLANLIAAPDGPANDFYRAEYKTFSRIYPQVYSFPTKGGIEMQNIELVATKNATPVTQATLRRRNARRDIGIDLADEIADLRTDEDTDDVPLLRDDDAPVDSLLDPSAGQSYVVTRAD